MIDRARNRTAGTRAWSMAALVLVLAMAGCKSSERDFEAAPPPVAEPEAPAEPAFTEAPEVETAPLAGTDEANYGEATQFARRIALILPLSGQYSGVGNNLLDAASLALFDIGGDRMELIVADTKGTPEGAATAVRQALAGAPDLIVGPLFAQEVTAASPIAEQAGIPMIALSSDLTVARPGVYLLGIAPEQQIERVVSHAAQQGYLRFAVLAPQNAFGRRMAGAMEQAVAQSGGQVVQRAFYNPDGLGIEETVRELTRYKARQADLEAQIAELRLRGDEVSLATIARLEEMEAAGTVSFDALLIPESGSLLRELSAWLGYYDVNPNEVRLLGLANWNDPSLLREPVLRGAWYAMTPQDRMAWFNSRFEAAYGTTPPPVAALAYDAMALAAGLARNTEQGEFSQAAVTDWRGFSGIEGVFRFQADGEPERGMVVMEIQPGGAVVADPAPTSFRPPAVSMLVD
jgi:ABC-type branched-subunit amino acid transport system substrate-binding protein